MNIDLFFSSEPSVYPLKTLENLTVFWCFQGVDKGCIGNEWVKHKIALNPLSANPAKWPNTLKQFVGKLPTSCLSVFDHFVELALKGLKVVTEARRRNLNFNLYWSLLSGLIQILKKERRCLLFYRNILRIE